MIGACSDAHQRGGLGAADGAVQTEEPAEPAPDAEAFAPDASTTTGLDASSLDAAPSPQDGGMFDGAPRIDGGPTLDASTPPRADGGLGPDSNTPRVDASANPDGSAIPPGSMQDAAPACPPDAGAGACGAHPLAGRYAARTVTYVRQRTSLAGQALDTVSKGVLLSVADISATGLVSEHLCLLELVNEVGLFSWSAPAAVERIPDSVSMLESRDGVFVRTRAADRTTVSWSAAQQPADCSVGATHSSGCLCQEPNELPRDPRDCRVLDLDGDGLPGLKVSVALDRPGDPATAEGLLSLQVAATKAVEWRIAPAAGVELVGQVEGSLDQVSLSAAGELASQLGPIRQANCPSELGHVELVRGAFDCATLLAGRGADPDGYGVFEVALDGAPPELATCPDPDCAVDGDGDGSSNCDDGCPSDREKTAPGACGCGVADTNTDGDSLPDCGDECDADPAKTAAGACGCGVADSDADGDSLADCSDECDGDPNKTSAGTCGCGIPDTDSDDDGRADCSDECDADPEKTVPGLCGCGVRDADLNGDGAIDCSDLCPGDPAKLAPGLCGCGVADSNADADAQPDCRDECDGDPAKIAPGQCGCGIADTDGDRDGSADCRDQCPADPARSEPGACGCGGSACANPLLGTYAVRSTAYSKQRIGTSAATTSKAIGYSLVTIANGAGALQMTERSCWAQTLPNPSESGLSVYAWVSPSWAAALPNAVRTLTASSDGTWSGELRGVLIGWDPSRQPAACSDRATPPAGWPSGWGATCTCNGPATSLPPFDGDLAPYDCRLTDPDQDGYPGLSGYASTAPPSSPSQEPSGVSARGFAAGTSSNRWTITPASDGRHTATVRDESSSVAVGCTGLACAGLGSSNPLSRECPESFNRVQFIPATASSDSCEEILAQRTTLFATDRDADWPSEAACPAP